MSESPHSPFPHIELFPKLAKAGRFLGHLIFGPHLFSEVSDHFQHPLDEVFDKPPYTESDENFYGAWLDGERLS